MDEQITQCTVSVFFSFVFWLENETDSQLHGELPFHRKTRMLIVLLCQNVELDLLSLMLTGCKLLIWACGRPQAELKSGTQ